MSRFPEHIGSNEVRPVTVADEIHRVTVDGYIRIVREVGGESTELVRYRDPDGASYRTIDRFDVGENADRLDIAELLAH